MNATPLVQRITDLLPIAPQQYYRLILVVGPAGTGKTHALQQLSGLRRFPYVNVNLDLSRRLLDLSARERALRAPQMLGGLLPPGDGPVLLDNIEMLFHPDLRLDPLAAIQRLSRNRDVVAAWNGALANGRITYAHPGHEEYRQYDAVDLSIIPAEQQSEPRFPAGSER